MTKKARAQSIAAILDKLYPNPAVPLNHLSPYTLLVAVLLSAQCTDKRVNAVMPSLLVVADTPEKMSKISVETIQKIIRPCGLSGQKAKAISGLSKILVDKHGGKVPETFVDLEALPGIGHKSASVVMAQAFGEPAFPVDTHIHRLANRWMLSNGTNVTRTEKDLKQVFAQEIWNKIHLQIIYFGREYCPARGHNPEKCPICVNFGRRSMFSG